MIALFVTYRPFKPFLVRCNQFPWKKEVVYRDSVPQKAIATKIFINC